MGNDLISRSNLWTDIMMLPHNGDIISSEEVEQAIVDAPAVDAVKVVRCGECQRWACFASVSDYPNGYCSAHAINMKRFDFCSYGERRPENAAD